MGYFLSGGGGGLNHLPKKCLQVVQVFKKQLKRSKGHTINFGLYMK